MTGERVQTELLVIGSGIAGLSAALKAASFCDVTIITKKCAADGNTARAQGGVACVTDENDTIDDHVRDTLEAGAGLCREDVVRTVVSEGPARIRELLELGVHFTTRGEVDAQAEGQCAARFDLGREGGHSRRRVLHAGDVTGEEIVRGLLAACRKQPRIRLLENFQAVDLITSRRLDWDGPNRCLGAYVLDRTSYQVHTVLSKMVVLATGGAGKVYLYTSNPDVACGEGVAMAYRAYAEIANMEFYQFHPTCLFHPQAKSFLVSEAVRGEGATLKLRQRDEYVEFARQYHELGSLAPRDILARAIDRELKKSGQSCAYLDVRHHSEEYLRKRFPTIFETCLSFGVNMAREPIPVVPAAHYCCGGVLSDVNGRTAVEGLYAVGEVGCTGLHGANRLASNSLLEAMVVAHRAVVDIRERWSEADRRHLEPGATRTVPEWSSGDAVDPDELVVVYHNWDEIRRFMWDYVGIFRTTKRLQRAKARVRNIRKEIEHFYWDFTLTPDLVELRNMASVAEMIIDCAMQRRHSVGLHFNADYPGPPPPKASVETILHRPGFERQLY